jgi:hypothetical protein
MHRPWIDLACVLGLTAGVLGQAPPNDLCQSATPIFDGVNPGAPAGVSGSFFTNVGAGTEGATSCVAMVPPIVGSHNDVWFSYVATATGAAVFRTCTPPGFQPGTLPFPVLSVLSACGGIELACTGDASGCSTGGFSFAVVAGTTYLLRVARVTLSTGGPTPGTFYLTVIPPAPPVPNDLCANATPVFDGVNPNPPLGASLNFFTTTGATNDGSASCDPLLNDVWFSYAPTVSGVALARICTPPGFGSGTTGFGLSVHSACGGAELGCTSVLYDQSCAIPGNAWDQIAFLVTAGTSYLIRVATDSNVGSFYLTIVPPGPPPANDACASPITVVDGLNGPFSNANATPDGTVSCTPPTPEPARDVWFTYTALATGTATFTTSAPTPLAQNIAAQVAVLSACGGTELGCSFWGGAVSVPVSLGATYRIRVASHMPSGGATGAFNLTVNVVPTVPNDECATPTPLSLGANGPFMNLGATPSPGVTPILNDLWYSVTSGACPGSYTIDGCPQPQSAVWMQVFSACGVPAPAVLEFHPTCISWRVTFSALPSTTYFIRAHLSPANAPYYLNVSFATVPLLNFSSFAPGCLLTSINGLPPNGLYFLAVTVNQGNFPYGALYGIDILFPELIAELNTGAPFLGGADGCGNVQLGPFCGPISGITIYGVAIGFATAYVLPPTIVSIPASFTIL